MNQLPLWPPVLALALGLIGYAFFWFWARRIERDQEQAKQKHHPAE